MYRPPNTIIKDFNNEIEIILEHIKRERISIYCKRLQYKHTN